jgi:hypothetical protein
MTWSDRAGDHEARSRVGAAAIWPELTKRPDLTVKGTNQELMLPYG